MANPQAIIAPPAQPPVYGILTACDIISDAVRWQQGVRWAPEQINGGGASLVNCHGESTVTTGHSPIENIAEPFNVFAEDHCTTIGFEARDFEGRARRQLIAVQSSKIAREFQLGAIRDEVGGPENVALKDAQQVHPGGPAGVALGTLEAVIADQMGGTRCMIHVTPQTLVELAQAHLIYQGGQKWYTAPGNIVVSDAGYTDEDGVIMMYGTGIVQVRLSPIDVFPPVFAQAVNKATNFVTLYAERLALVQFDHSDVTLADRMWKVATDLTPWAAGS